MLFAPMQQSRCLRVVFNADRNLKLWDRQISLGGVQPTSIFENKNVNISGTGLFLHKAGRTVA